MRSTTKIVVMGVGLAISSQQLWAQVPPATSPSSAPAAAGQESLEEVTVTARRVSESLQRTPVAVTAIGGEALAARGSNDVSDIQQIAPNITFNSTASNSGSSNAAVVFIRGIGQSDFYPQVDPGVGIYLDGVYISRSTGAVLDTIDLGQIEVLRGPQGTLFGKNTIGGAINITSRRPAQDFGGYVEATGGKYSRIDGKARVDMPINDTLRTSLSFATLNRDGYYRIEDFNTKATTGHLGDVKALTGRFDADYDATSDLKFSLSADWTRRREESAGSTLLQVNTNGLAPLINNVVVAPTTGPNIIYDQRYITSERYVNYGDPKRSKSNLDIWGTALTGNWALSDSLSLKSITAYRKSKSDSDRDADGSPAVILQPATLIDQHQFSQEIQLLGDMFDKRLTFIGGLYYLDEGIFFDGPVNIAFVDTDNTAQIKNRSSAAFGQVGFKVTDALRLTVGARYTIDKKENDARVLATRLIDPATLTAVPAFALPIPLLIDDARRTDKKFTPAVTFDYQFAQNVFSYVTYSQGFKSGGFSQRIAFPRTKAPAFDPESVKNYEVGLKIEAFDRKLRINSAVFYTKYSNLQVIIFNQVEPLTQNGGEATLKGLETEIQLTPVQGLNFNLAVGYIDANYDQINPGTLIPPGANLAYTPEWTVSGGVNYQKKLSSNWKLRPEVDFSYRSAVDFDALNSAALRQKGFTLVNANFAVISPSDVWRISVGATNLTNRYYIIGGFSDLPATGLIDATYARPREWFVTVRRSF